MTPATIFQASSASVKRITARVGKIAWSQFNRHRHRQRSKMTIDRLPDEILEHIFVLAGELHPCRGQRDVTHTTRCMSCSAELVVSTVSRRWRAIALNYSRLWTTIRLSASTTPQALQLYLDRSRYRPLDVEIVVRMSKGATTASRPITQGALRTLLHTLLQALPRWRQLHVSTPFPDILDVVMSLLGQKHLGAPSLEVLAIECPFETGLLSGNGNMYPQPFPAGAPRLQHVQLHRCSFPLQDNESLSRLTSFEVASAPWTLSDLHVLSITSPQLTHLAVTSSYKLDSRVSLHFPNLRSLRIGDYFQNATILELMEAPQLEVLQIEDMEVQFNVTAGWYVDALRGDGSHGDQSKFPNLRSLRLQMPGSPEDPSPLIVGQRFSDFLRLFPSVEHLAFVGIHVHQFVRGLVALHSHVEPDDVLLPKLTHLTLGGQDELNTLGGECGVRFLESVMQLVKVRRLVNGPLRRIQVPVNVLARDRFLLRKFLVQMRHGSRKGLELEGVRMPYPSDVWLGYKWGLRMLPQLHGKNTLEGASALL